MVCMEIRGILLTFFKTLHDEMTARTQDVGNLHAVALDKTAEAPMFARDGMYRNKKFARDLLQNNIQ